MIFPLNKKHKECAHKELKGDEARKPWLKEGSKVLNKNRLIKYAFVKSKEIDKLTAALRGHGDIRLNDLENMTGTCFKVGSREVSIAA